MPRIITITSPGRGAGKKSVTLNLALALRRGGRKVLLVDTGFESGEVGDLVSGTSPKTVAEFFAGQGSLADCTANVQGGLVIMQAERRGGIKLLDTGVRSYAIAAPQLDLLEKFDDLLVVCQAEKESDNIALILASDLAVLLLGENDEENKDVAGLLSKLSERGYRGKIMLLPNRFKNSDDANSCIESVMNQAGESAPERVIIELPSIPEDKTFEEAKENFTPLILGWPDSPAGIAFYKVADDIGPPSSQQVNAPLSSFFKKVFSLHKNKNKQEEASSEENVGEIGKSAAAKTVAETGAGQKIVYLNNPAQSASSPELAQILERNSNAQERLADVLEKFVLNTGSSGSRPGSKAMVEPFPLHPQLQPGEVKISYQTFEYFQKEN